MTIAFVKTPRRWVALALGALALGVTTCAHARVLRGDASSDDYFAEPCFSFRIGGRPSQALLTQWQVRRSSKVLDGRRAEREIVWTDPATRMEVMCRGIEYFDFDAVEWTIYLRNNGSVNSAVIEDLQGLDLTYQRASGTEFTLHGNKGDWCTADSFEPFDATLAPGTDTTFAPYGGRPTNTAFPYYNLQMPGGGVFLAVGWPGQWASSFVRDSDRGLHITAGQERIRTYLRPGEVIRSPLIAIVRWRGTDTVTAQNIWRHWMLEHNLPRTADGALPETQVVACSSHQFKEMTQATEENQELFVDRYLKEGMKLDYWWMDAGWYPCGGEWVKTGTWEPDKARFPHGLRAVSDFAHARGVKTVLWFEPERVGDPQSWLAVQHPEWLLKIKAKVPAAPKGGLFGSGPGSLLNLGDPDALRWLTDHVNHLLTTEGIDLYRQDFNIEPLAFWRGADGPDREGITENLYLQGYLAYWDALRARHPLLRIDTCASGGRRNDLETLRRAVPLLRSDFLFEPTSQQNHHYVYASWIPYDGGGYAVGHSALGFGLKAGIEAYGYRSNMCPSLNLCYDVRSTELDYNFARTLFSQLKQVGPDYLGDFYPLTPYSLSNSTWLAWQYFRPSVHRGMVQAFRRPESTTAGATFRLRGLDRAAQYRVTDLDHPVAARTHSGAELMDRGLTIDLPVQPSAALITYQQVP